MQAVSSAKSEKKAKPVKVVKEAAPAPEPVKVKGDPQMQRKPRLAKGIKVPREVKVLAALSYPTDRVLEKSFIRASAAVIHANDVRAKTRGKEKREE
jgi:hypothetical protein